MAILKFNELATRRETLVLTPTMTQNVAVTVRVADYDKIIVFNNSSFILGITLDGTDCETGDEVTVTRYAIGNEGLVQLANTGELLIKDKYGNYKPNDYLPATPGNRTAVYAFSPQGYWDLLSSQHDYQPVLPDQVFARGDLLVHDGNGFARLPKGADGTSLKMVGGLPTWVA